MLNQFKNYFNIFFLITAVVLSIPQISQISPFTSITPFLIVTVIGIVREGFEDSVNKIII